MAHLPRAVLAHLARSHGVATVGQLLELGLSAHGLRDIRAAGGLVEVLRGVYRCPVVPFDELARCVAVSARFPDAAIADVTAGRLWGFRRLPADRRVHIVVPPATQHCSVPWVVQYRTAAIHLDDRVIRPDGIVVTSRARTALDLGRRLNREDALSVMEQAMSDGRLVDADMRGAAIDWLSPQRPWVRRFLQLLDRRLRGGPAESHDEVRVGDALAAGGVIGIRRQFEVDLPGYGPARFDLAVPRLRWAIEVDSFPTHRETVGRCSDLLRDTATDQIGWSITRLTPDHLGIGFERTIARLVAEFRYRSAATSSR